MTDEYSFVYSGVFQTAHSGFSQQFRTDYLQPADQVHLYPSFWHVFQGWQVSILGMCFYSLAGIPPQAIPRCWGSLKLCASISKMLSNLVWNLLCAITLLMTHNCCVVPHRLQGKVQPYIPEDSEDLVNLWIPMEKWLFSCQLSKYGSYAPDIYRSRVTSRPQQHFWRPVPQCHYLWNKERLTLWNQVF